MSSARALNDPSYPTAGAPRPLLTLLTGEEYEGDGRPRLDLSYHRHYYALGAHYNAVVGS